MSRPKGTKNARNVSLPDTVALLPQERIDLLASIMVDRIFFCERIGSKVINLLLGSKS
jgi:hypothetical protein